MDDHFYEPRLGHGLPHDPFKAVVAPRPVGWISSIDREGRPNLAPYSFFNAVCDRPPLLCFSTGGWRKDSLANLEDTGEFVVNFVGARHAAAMNASAAPVPRGVNEFELAGVEAAPCRLVKPPRVAGAIAAMECRLVRVLPLTDAAGKPVEAWLTLGEVVGVHLSRDCLRDGHFDVTLARPLGRCGYRGDYTEVRETFEMLRPG